MLSESFLLQLIKSSSKASPLVSLNPRSHRKAAGHIRRDDTSAASHLSAALYHTDGCSVNLD